MVDEIRPDETSATPSDETVTYGRFVDAGLAIGALLKEAGYVPSQRMLARVFERLYWQFAPESMDRPDAQAWLGGGFLEGLRQGGFERPGWMRSGEWLRMILALPQRGQARG